MSRSPQARSTVQRDSGSGRALVDAAIQDAMEDGVLDTSERQLIAKQAQRSLSPTERAEVEARMAQLPTGPARPAAELGLPTPLAPEGSRRAEVVPTGFETPANTAAAQDRPAAGTHQTCSNAACCENDSADCLSNMYLFTAADAWRGPLDGNQSNNFGFRIGANAGFPLLEEGGIGGQLGVSYGAYDFHGRFDLAAESETASIEDQLFFTAGIFQRCCVPDWCNACWQDRISWGVVYDYMITDNTSACAAELNLGQFRGQVAYACDADDEVGFAGSITDGTDDDFQCLGVNHTTRSIDQLNVFWHHKWCTRADTTLYTGIAEDPGEWLIGANAQMPLNSYWALFGGFHYILPSTSGGDPGFRDEIWNVTAGIAFYPGGNAISSTVCGRRWLPLLPVADNGTFALDLGF